MQVKWSSILNGLKGLPMEETKGGYLNTLLAIANSKEPTTCTHVEYH